MDVKMYFSLICIFLLFIIPEQSNSIDPQILAMFMNSKRDSSGSGDGDGSGSAEIVARFGLDVLKLSNAKNYSHFNFVFSPWTIVNNIGAVYKATKGQTKAEIKRQLLKGVSDSKFFGDMKSCLTNLHKSKRKKQFYDFRALSAIFIDQRLIKPAKTIFDTSLKSFFGCETKPLDLRTKSRAVSKINKFIHSKMRKTFGSGGNEVSVAPPNMLDQLDPDWMNLVLANALYFKGNWSIRNELTTMRSFTTDDHRQLTVQALTMKGETFLYKKTSFMELVGIPYKGDDLFLFVITPTNEKIVALETFEQTLDYKRLLKYMGEAKRTPMEVHLPIFKITATFDAKPLLQGVGVNRLFDPRQADFSNQVLKISSDKNQSTFVSNVVHAAHITVGKTPNYISPNSKKYSYLKYQQWRADFIQKQPFHANRPFLFALVDMSMKKTILLLGRVVHP